MSNDHPYRVARSVLLDLHKLFLQHGDQLWSVSPTGFRDIGLDEETARNALRLLATKKLVRHVGTNSFVISDYGVSACDHPSTLDRELPAPSEAQPLDTSIAGRAAPATASGSLDQYVPLALQDRFVAVCHLGSGSFGAVYQVHDRESLQRFALKVTRPAPDARARAEREASAMATLRHENVLLAVEFDPRGDWFIFPLAEGTLGQLQSWGRLTPATALTLAREVGSALAHAHAAGLVHRDLHVDNILRHDGAWRVADWGLNVGRGQNRLTRTRSVGGNETWTAPEQLKSLRDADARSDLYSLGRIVEWLASGVLPEPDRPGVLPSGHPLAVFVNAVTQLNRDKRPPNAEAALALLPTRTNPTSPPTALDVPTTSLVHRLPPVPTLVLDRCRERHTARLEHVRNRSEQTIALEKGPAIVLHLCPTGDAREFDLLPLKAGRFQPLPPIAHVHWQARFNHDGLVAYPQESTPVSQRLQLFRDGAIEFVDTYSVQRIQAPKPILFPLSLERDIVSFVEHWTRTILQPLGVLHPLVLCLSLTGIDGFELHIDRPSPVPKPLFDRESLSFRPVVLDGTQDIRRLMKPTFDALWQAAGEDRSLGYSPDGEWLDGAHPRR
jgi:serine/threonine protein kinase